MYSLGFLENRSQTFTILVGAALIGAIGILDYFTGYELSFSFFYVIPITLITWRTGRKGGIPASIVSAAVWLWADVVSGHVYSNPLFPIWNMLIRLSLFLIIAILLAELSAAMQREKELARTDPLTGALNGRQFFDSLRLEIRRLQRYNRPFSLVYIDLDNFKLINDRDGHPTGDQVLRSVVATAKMQFRSTDMIARLGGDEFAILFPETDQAAAKVAISKFQNAWQNVLQNSTWQTTFSLGALTCLSGTITAEELVKKADELMYRVKQNQKNSTLYDTYQDVELPDAAVHRQPE